VVEEYMDRNPATKLQVAVETRKKDRWSPFSTKQLKTIFNAPLYTGCKDDEAGYDVPGPNRPRRGRFWVPLLALFTGMRLNVCCQLDVADVAKLDGVWVIYIREDSESGADDKRVKSDAGQRFVPVHPELVRIGFHKYVQERKKAGDAKLFPELPRGKNGYYSDPFGKWFGRFLKKAGAKAPRTSFHSFRHSYRDALREAGISPERVRALGGWAGGSGGAEEIYGGGFKASTLAKEIRKLSQGYSIRQISRTLSMGVNSVHKIVSSARKLA
jgi:integrase